MINVYGCGGALVSGTIPPTVLRHTTRTAGVMVWGAITYDSRSTLIVMRGTLTCQRYVDDILRPHVGPFLNGLPGAIFQQDNARLHTARVAQDFLRHFQTLPWPARFPDLSPVEHVWDQLKRQMPSCDSVHDLDFGFKQCRFKLISGPSRRRSTGPLGTDGSKLTGRQCQKIWLSAAYPDPGRPMDKLALDSSPGATRDPPCKGANACSIFCGLKSSC
ncbi:DDE_3 domain-containing protein [Trichonephila clavipes]|nr:DDE_3 domain-containing protein [Trichonephila clavipes]